MNAEPWQCAAAELRCSPQMASSRVRNIFHLFSSFSVWRQFTLHCSASLSSIYFTVQRAVRCGVSEQGDESIRYAAVCPLQLHSNERVSASSSPKCAALLSNCPFFSPCVYSSVHSSVAVSAVIWTWTHKISSWQ